MASGQWRDGGGKGGHSRQPEQLVQRHQSAHGPRKPVALGEIIIIFRMVRGKGSRGGVKGEEAEPGQEGA